MGDTGTDRGSAGRKLLIALLVLVVVLIAVDRVGNAVAERYAADTIQSSQHLPNRPSVDVTGFPFLTQLAAGNFDEIILSDGDVPIADSSRVRLTSVRVDLHHVHVARDLSSVRADTADATATMSFADLGRALGVPIRYAGHGRVRASKSISIDGHAFTGSVSALPRVAGEVLSFGDTKVSGLNAVVAQAAPVVQKILGTTLSLRGIPFSVHVRSIHVDDTGLHLALTGRNLSYSR